MKSFWYIAALLMGIGISCKAYALPANPWAVQPSNTSSQGNGLPNNPWVKKTPSSKPVMPQNTSQTRPSYSYDDANNQEKNEEDQENQGFVAQELQNFNEAYCDDIRQASHVYGQKLSDGFEAVGDKTRSYGRDIQKGYNRVSDTTKAYGQKIQNGYDNVVNTAEDYGRKIKRGYNSAVNTAKYYGRQVQNSFKVLGNELSSLKRSF